MTRGVAELISESGCDSSIAEAQRWIDRITAAGYALVKLPCPDELDTVHRVHRARFGDVVTMAWTSNESPRTVELRIQRRQFTPDYADLVGRQLIAAARADNDA